MGNWRPVADVFASSDPPRTGIYPRRGATRECAAVRPGRSADDPGEATVAMRSKSFGDRSFGHGHQTAKPPALPLLHVAVPSLVSFRFNDERPSRNGFDRSFYADEKAHRWVWARPLWNG
jgi:hypothetical protein